MGYLGIVSLLDARDFGDPLQSRCRYYIVFVRNDGGQLGEPECRQVRELIDLMRLPRESNLDEGEMYFKADDDPEVQAWLTNYQRRGEDSINRSRWKQDCSDNMGNGSTCDSAAVCVQMQF